MGYFIVIELNYIKYIGCNKDFTFLSSSKISYDKFMEVRYCTTYIKK